MAGVTSKPMRDPKESAIITRARLRKQRGSIERWTAWVVLLVSFLGSIAALHGGWPPLIASIRTLQPHWAALLGGLAIQALLTYLEWHYFDVPLIAWLARLFDALTTALGYGPLVEGWLRDASIALMVSDPSELTTPAIQLQGDIAAWCIIGIVSLLVAWYPESRLVE